MIVRPSLPARTRPDRGSALVIAMALVLVLAVAAVALIRLTGADQTRAGVMGRTQRGVLCAEAGLQYARRFFGAAYETSNGWNSYLNGTTAGYRFDPGASPPDAHPDLTNLGSIPKQALGYSNGSTLDPGADLDGDGNPDFWVSIRDDDDERPLGIAANDPTRDNNERIIIRSECINPGFTTTVSGSPVNAVAESYLLHVQGSSGYGTAQRGANATDLVGGR